jgi:acyl-CoA hydrolase
VTSVELSVPAASTPKVLLAAVASISSTKVAPNAEIVVFAAEISRVLSTSPVVKVKVLFAVKF